MNRRVFLKAAAAATAAYPLSSHGVSLHGAAASPAFSDADWQTYEVSTTVELLRPAGRTRIWVPLALKRTPFQHVLRTEVECEHGAVSKDHLGPGEPGVLLAEFRDGVRPALQLTQRVATRNWRVDLESGEQGPGRPDAGALPFLEPTRYVPTTGIVKEKADEITCGANTDLAKTRAIYSWVVENTYRDAKTRGCGRGDIRVMLESGHLGGKCADLNALFVGLLRASGVPARDVYGIRIAPSQRGFKSLGTASENSSKAQHCRAEVYLHGQGWVPMDPADVRKVILEETPGSLALTSPGVQLVRERLFGGWEMNWMAYNYGQDVELPGSSGPPLPFFMYPQAETEEGRLDSLDPDGFRYVITSRKVA